MSQECDMAIKKTNTILSSIHVSIISKSWEVIIPMYSFSRETGTSSYKGNKEN